MAPTMTLHRARPPAPFVPAPASASPPPPRLVPLATADFPDRTYTYTRKSHTSLRLRCAASYPSVHTQAVSSYPQRASSPTMPVARPRKPCRTCHMETTHAPRRLTMTNMRETCKTARKTCTHTHLPSRSGILTARPPHVRAALSSAQPSPARSASPNRWNKGCRCTTRRAGPANAALRSVLRFDPRLRPPPPTR